MDGIGCVGWWAPRGKRKVRGSFHQNIALRRVKHGCKCNDISDARNGPIKMYAMVHTCGNDSTHHSLCQDSTTACTSTEQDKAALFSRCREPTAVQR